MYIALPELILAAERICNSDCVLMDLTDDVHS